MIRWGGVFAALTLIVAVAMPAPAHSLEQPACASAHGWLLLERDSQAIVVDPPDGEAVRLDLAPSVIERLHRPLALPAMLGTPQWDVQRASGDDAYEFTVRDPGTGEAILAATFDRRIEIASSTVSPTGRFTVFIQANNRASEVTVLDAAEGERRDIRIPHDEELAAFAIGSAFSRDESCLAISMERVGGNGPETWLIDLESGAINPAIPGFAITWA
jgi:hypothetical protein